MAIGGLSSGTSTVQRPDTVKSASELLARTDTKKQGDSEQAALKSASAASSATDADYRSNQADTDGARQLASELDAQFSNSRVARAETGSKRPSSEEIFASLDTKNQGYLDKQTLQAAFDKKSSDTAANTAKVEQVFKTVDTDGDNKISKLEFTSSIDQPDGQSASAVDGSSAGKQAVGAPPPPPPPPRAGGAAQEAAATEAYDAADTNQDGTVSLQELVAYQTSEASKEAVKTDAQTNLDAATRLTTQLAQTYGRFDQDIANATSSVNLISAAA